MYTAQIEAGMHKLLERTAARSRTTPEAQARPLATTVKSSGARMGSKTAKLKSMSST